MAPSRVHHGYAWQRPTAQTTKGPGSLDHTLLLWGGPHCLLPELRCSSSVCSAVNGCCQRPRASETLPLVRRMMGGLAPSAHCQERPQADTKTAAALTTEGCRSRNHSCHIGAGALKTIRKACAALATTRIHKIPPRDPGRSRHLLRNLAG